jgi:hypothetical protein
MMLANTPPHNLTHCSDWWELLVHSQLHPARAPVFF